MERETRIIGGVDSNGDFLFFSAGPESSGMAYAWTGEHLLAFVGEDDLLSSEMGMQFGPEVNRDDLAGAKVPAEGSRALVGIGIPDGMPITLPNLGELVAVNDALIRDIIESQGVEAVRELAAANPDDSESELRRAMREAVAKQDPVLN